MSHKTIFAPNLSSIGAQKWAFTGKISREYPMDLTAYGIAHSHLQLLKFRAFARPGLCPWTPAPHHPRLHRGMEPVHASALFRRRCGSRCSALRASLGSRGPSLMCTGSIPRLSRSFFLCALPRAGSLDPKVMTAFKFPVDEVFCESSAAKHLDKSKFF